MKHPFFFRTFKDCGPVVVPIGYGRDAAGNQVAFGFDRFVIFKSESILKNKGVFVSGIAVASERKIAEAVNNISVLIGLNTLNDMGMVTHHHIRALVNCEPAQFFLNRIGIIIPFNAPMKADDD